MFDDKDIEWSARNGSVLTVENQSMLHSTVLRGFRI